MSKEEILKKIEKIIISGNYDIEELLEAIPDYLLNDVVNLIEMRTQKESEDISKSLKTR